MKTMITKSERPNSEKLRPHGAKAAEKKSTQQELRAFPGDIFSVLKDHILHLRWRDYVLSLALVALVTLVGLPFDHSFDHANIVMLYLLAEVIAATRFGLGPSILAALASVMAYHYFFILPRFTFAVDEAQYLLTFAGLLIVGLLISTLTSTIREQVRTAQRREAQTAASYDFSRALAAAVGLEAIIRATIIHVKRVFNRDAVILLPEPNRDSLSSHTFNPGFIIDEHEQAVATWSFQSGQPAGRGTQTLPATSLRFHPLKTARGVVGVLGVKSPEFDGHLTTEQFRLLEIFASQAAVAIERAQLDEQAQQAKLHHEKDKLQAALLNSISHDLRTPLASITGVLSSIRDDAGHLDENTQRELVENACDEADRMNRLVANLLDMTRLQAGAMRAGRELCDVQDVVGVALAELSDKIKDRPVTIEFPNNPSLVPIDFVLMSRVFINLLDNAHKYSPSGTRIEIQAHSTDSNIEIEIADRGLGIPPAELTHVFEKFYRVRRNDGASGTGLGLSICKGIVEVHGGRIWATNRPGGGTIVTVSLPMVPPTIPLTEVNA
jgi:two-component system sensor histidine kinase KdpD